MGRLNKRLSTLFYTSRSIYREISSLQVPSMIIALIVAGVAIFLLGGGVYDILMNPVAVFPLRGRIIVWYPYYIHEQSLTASVGVMILYAIGTAGLFMIYESTKYFRRPRQASILLIIGVLLIVLAYFSVETILYWKMYSR